MVKLEINSNLEQIRRALKKLSWRDKEQLLKDLTKERMQQINKIISKARQRRKSLKMSDQDISNEIEKARQEFHARRSH